MSDKAKFFKGQDVEPDDVNFLETQRVSEQNTRFLEISAFSGILFGFTPSNPSAYVIEVSAGVAWDDLGRTLRLITGDSQTLRAAPKQIGFTAGDVGKFITLAYAEEEQAQVAHPITGALNKTRVISYPTIQLRSVAGANEVVIGAISSIDGSGNATFDLSVAQYWGARLHPDQLADLAEAVQGLRKHQQLDHVSGIERKGAGGDPGALTIDDSTVPDDVVVSGMVVGDALVSSGRRLVDGGALTDLRIRFIDGAVTAAPQLWAIRVAVGTDPASIDGDVVGSCYKQLVAQYAASPVIPGMQLVDVAPFGVPYPSPLIINHVYASGQHQMRLSGQTALVIPTTDGLYLFRRDDDPDIAVLVYITMASLPTTGTVSDPLVETITLYPDAISDVDDGDLLLGFVWWAGTALNQLGYGTWGSSGAAYDKRRYGTLRDTQVADEFETRLTRLLSETRTNGFVSKPSLINFFGIFATMQEAPLDAGSDYSTRPYAYIDGKRVRVPLIQQLVLTASATLVIYLQDDGDGTASWGFQTGSGTIGVELAPGRMPVWNVTTNGSGVPTIVDDLTVVLPDLDREAVRLDRKNVGGLEITGELKAGSGLFTAIHHSAITGYTGTQLPLKFNATSNSVGEYLPCLRDGKVVKFRAISNIAPDSAVTINLYTTTEVGGATTAIATVTILSGQKDSGGAFLGTATFSASNLLWGVVEASAVSNGPISFSIAFETQD